MNDKGDAFGSDARDSAVSARIGKMLSNVSSPFADEAAMIRRAIEGFNADAALTIPGGSFLDIVVDGRGHEKSVTASNGVTTLMFIERGDDRSASITSNGRSTAADVRTGADVIDFFLLELMRMSG
ncbi:MAG TPA: hypothetical protein VEB64_08075 [Azospirillaceae bacterium]|nr:hypothetical protein [Azospirillaceae bacterium]